jgi:ABC-2 type transport system permease protein
VTDRARLFRIVARREFVERVRERSFIVSTAVSIVILVGIVVAARVLERPASFEVGTVGREAAAAAGLARAAAATQGVGIRVVPLAGVGEAERALREGRVDAVLVGEERIVVRSGPPPVLLGILQASAQQLRVRSALVGAGLPPEEAAQALAPLPVQALEPERPGREEDRSLAFVAVLILYGQMFGYGVWVATGIVEEKSSRVVELLLAAVRPRQLLLGKIVGLGLLGLFQLLVIGSVGLAAALLAEVVRVPATALGSLGLVLVWFVLGFAFYSGLFACAGATVSRQEELQNALLPLQLLVLGSLVVAISSVEDPSSTLSRVASFVPATAPLAMPPRLIAGDAGPLDALASVAISLAATAALVPVAARIYAGAILRVGGRVRWREAWRAERGAA